MRALNLVCSSCGELIPHGKLRCPSCKQWQTGAVNDESVMLCDIVPAEKLRIRDNLAGLWTDGGNSESPNPRIRDGFGGGIVLTSVTLLAGHPGAGKSTILLQLSKTLADATKKETLYIAAEEAKEEIKSRADRLGVGDANIRIIPAMGGISNLGELIARRNPGAVILDSLQGLVGSEHDAAELTLKNLKGLAVLLNAPIIVVSHVTKGESFAGTMTLQHEVDCLVTLELSDDDGTREWFVHKHRQGKAYVSTELEMTEHGLEWELEDE